MLLLRFLWLFLFIVIVYARPIFKSMDNDYINYSNFNISNNVELKDKGYNFFKHFITQTKNVLQTTKPRQEFKRKISFKEGNFNDFETYESTKCPGDYHGNILYKLVKSKSKKNKSFLESKNFNDELNLETTLNIEPDFRFIDYSKNFLDLKSMTSSYDDGELDTAEIEAVLNEIKHREIEIIAEDDPSITSLITSTVDDLLYRSSLHFGKNTFPPYTSPEVPNKGKHTKTTKKHPKTKHHHHIFARSISKDTSTLAQNIENKLQNKIKNVFEAVKKKIAHDYNKEVTYTKESIKQAYGDLTKKLCNITKSTQKEPPSSTKPVTNNAFNKTTRKLRYTNKSSERYTKVSDKKTTHTIPTLGDDFSMLTIFEQLLSKTQERNVINILTTNTPSNEISSRTNKNSIDVNQEIIDEYEYPNTGLDLRNEENNSLKTSINEFDSTIQSDTTTEDMSFEALSNKLSYNDYVNGYKYYLNFQKQQDDNKFSNLIRYQAHMHHKVDDIGKYILNKIPRLSTTRIKRHFVEPETLEDQDVSTKSEDSWFKKHFFLFLDTDPSKKFHSTQTISCKDNDFIKNNKLLSTLSNKNKTLKGEGHNLSQRHKERNLSIEKMVPKRYIKYKRYINENITKLEDMNRLQNKYQKPMWSNNDENLLQKYTNINLNTRSTTVVKLQKKKKKKPIRVFHLFRHKEKQKHKREDRVQRFNIFKGIKDIFKDYPKYSPILQEKLFDYEIMTSPKPHSERMSNFQIDEMVRQIPNISSNFVSVYPIIDYNKLNEDSLKYTKDSVYSTSMPTSKLAFEKISSIDNKENDIWLSYGTNYNPQFKLTSAPYEPNTKPSLPVQLYTTTDFMDSNFKTNLTQTIFDFPVTIPSFDKIVKDNEINNKDRIKLATFQPKKQNVAKHETEDYIKKYIFKSTTANSIDKGMTKFLINLKDSTLETSYDMYKSNEGAEYNRDRVFVAYKNKNQFEKYKKLPEQYFSTPLPMNIKEFNTFLKEHHMDVQSVTAPLRNSISFSGDKKSDKWKVNVPKSLNDTIIFRNKQKKIEMIKGDKDKENVKLIGYDIANIKQGPYDLNYFDIKDKNLYKDAFRFTNMKTYGRFIDNTSTMKAAKVIKHPKRVQVSGHNYRYDIVFHNMKDRDDVDYNSGNEIGI